MGSEFNDFVGCSQRMQDTTLPTVTDILVKESDQRKEGGGGTWGNVCGSGMEGTLMPFQVCQPPNASMCSPTQCCVLSAYYLHEQDYLNYYLLAVNSILSHPFQGGHE